MCLVWLQENQNHACFYVISKDNSENELCVNQTDDMFGVAFSTCAECMRVRNLQKQPVLFGYICGQHSEI